MSYAGSVGAPILLKSLRAVSQWRAAVPSLERLVASFDKPASWQPGRSFQTRVNKSGNVESYQNVSLVGNDDAEEAVITSDNSRRVYYRMVK